MVFFKGLKFILFIQVRNPCIQSRIFGNAHLLTPDSDTGIPCRSARAVSTLCMPHSSTLSLSCETWGIDLFHCGIPPKLQITSDWLTADNNFHRERELICRHNLAYSKGFDHVSFRKSHVIVEVLFPCLKRRNIVRKYSTRLWVGS